MSSLEGAVHIAIQTDWLVQKSEVGIIKQINGSWHVVAKLLILLTISNFATTCQLPVIQVLDKLLSAQYLQTLYLDGPSTDILLTRSDLQVIHQLILLTLMLQSTNTPMSVIWPVVANSWVLVSIVAAKLLIVIECNLFYFASMDVHTVTVKTFIMLKNISNKCCSFELSI